MAAIQHTNRLSPNGNGQNLPSKQQGNVTDFIEKLKPELARALPPAVAKVLTPERLSRLALTACRMNPRLGDCDFKSLAGALMTAAQLGLEPNTPLGHCYLIPRKNGKTGMQEATFQLGYQGMIELSSRSGRIQTQYAFPVYARDEFDYWQGLEPNLIHRPAVGDRGPLVAVYAVAKYKDGGSNFVVLTIDEVESYRKRSMARDSGPWITDYEAMACKTAFRRLFRWLPKSTELALAISADDSVPTWNAMTGEVAHEHQVQVEASTPWQPVEEEPFDDVPAETAASAPAPAPAPVEPQPEKKPRKPTGQKIVETQAREAIPDEQPVDNLEPAPAAAAPAPATVNEMPSQAAANPKAQLARTIEGWVKTAAKKFEDDGQPELADQAKLIDFIYKRLTVEGMVFGNSTLRHRQVMDLAQIADTWEPIHSALKLAAETIAREMYGPAN